MTSSFQFGSQAIGFRVEYTDRKTLGITVTPELEVIVRAPVNTSMEKIKSKLKPKAPWIIRQQRHFEAFHPKTPARKFISGESHYYMGRQYRLLVQEGKEESVKLKGQFLVVTTPSKARSKQLVESWYMEHAKRRLIEIAAPLVKKFKKYKVAPTDIWVRRMPTRWGSCTEAGRIILNPELIKAARGCIEYVIVHEMCHLVHYDHNRKFFELQNREMPGWEKWKGRLERMLA
jgi:predicted metal-dependent hydrolase